MESENMGLQFQNNKIQIHVSIQDANEGFILFLQSEAKQYLSCLACHQQTVMCQHHYVG